MRIHQMENAMLRRWIAAVAAAAFAFAPLLAFACTGIRLTAADGSIVAARTLEFSIDLDSNVLVVPRGYARTGTTPDGKEGLKWTSKYASVGANGVGLPVIFDGFNEKGLYAGFFYFPTSAGYMPYAAADAGKTLEPWELLLDFDKFRHRRGGPAAMARSPSQPSSFRGWPPEPQDRFTMSSMTRPAPASSSSRSPASSRSMTIRSA